MNMAIRNIVIKHHQHKHHPHRQHPRRQRQHQQQQQHRQPQQQQQQQPEGQPFEQPEPAATWLGYQQQQQHHEGPRPCPRYAHNTPAVGAGSGPGRRRRRQRHVLAGWITFWLCAACLLTPALPEVIYRVDPLALLAATLRTYQRAGCDSEQLALSCPRGTSISIELAQYGRAGDLSDHSLCPPVSQEDLTTTGSTSDSVVHSGTEIEVKPPQTCTVSGLQYALLQTVVDACQKKRHCKFSANPKTSTAALSSRDPCSGIRKFVEIAYKCRPYEFRSKVACENDNMPLVCNPYSRIAIYSASFGHIERESAQCGQGHQQAASADESAKQTCLVSYATETVMQICHGRRRCSVTADAGTFGRPCKNDVRMYLKVVYTCIPRKVLKDRYETAPEGDEPQQSELDMDQDELYDEDQFYKESEAIPPAPKMQGAIPNPAFPFDFMGNEVATSTLLPPLLSRNDNSLEENQEQFYLYLIISVAVGVMLCLTLVIGRLTLQRRRGVRKSSSSISNNEKSCSDAGSGGGGGGGGGKYSSHTSGETQLPPHSFGDEISDIDADIDLTSPMPVPSMPSRNETYITYAPTPSCSYGGGLPPTVAHSTAGGGYTTGTTMLMPPHHVVAGGGGSLGGMGGPGMGVAGCGAGLPLSGPASQLGAAKAMGGSLMSATRQGTPPPPGTLYTSMGMGMGGGMGVGMGSPTVSGTLTMGPHVLAPSVLNPPHSTAAAPSYLSGSIMVPGHHQHHPHVGTLRRTLVPGGSGMTVICSAAPTSVSNAGPHSLTGIPSASSIYYDTTIPRNLNRGMSADQAQQYFYG